MEDKIKINILKIDYYRSIPNINMTYDKARIVLTIDRRDLMVFKNKFKVINLAKIKEGE